MIDTKEYIKKMTSIPEAFIDELFQLYGDDKVVLQTDFVINLDAVTKWLKTQKWKLVETLNNSYKKDIDYIVTKPTNIVKKDNRHNNYKLYLLTPDCFKRLAMLSRSKNAELIRTYFIEIENLFLRYREETISGMQQELEKISKSNKLKSKIEPQKGYIYIIRASDKSDNLYKIGRSKDLTQRLRNYQTGKADDVELLYMYKTEDIIGAESCVKGFLKTKYSKYNEVYKADLEIIKNLIKDCSRIGAKLSFKQNKSIMTGGYFIVLDRDSHSMSDGID